MKTWLWVLMLVPVLGLAQDKKAALEAQKKQLQQEIVQINALLNSSAKKRANVLTEVETVQLKMDRQDALIRLTNRQINRLNQEITLNLRNIEQLRAELTQLKKDYAEMVVAARKNQSTQNRLMFLLSSESFWQAYKRMAYMKQYAAFRKQQGEKIAEKTKTLQQYTNDLVVQRKDKEQLIQENREAQKALDTVRARQNSLVQQLKRKEKSYAAQIKKKQQQQEALDKEINRLIREAIAASNKKAGTKTTSFVLTPEAKALAASFVANKGRLPWPVEKGIVTQKFGTQPHPIVRTTTIKSNGVTLSVPEAAEARSVFEGLVLNIVQFKGSNPIVLVQHGNYITSYKNLSKVYVKKGDKLSAKQAIGQIFTNKDTGKTALQFSLFQNTTPQNPALWLYQMK
ncbi:MAG: peptidoglycan DD-metalloendopeptidase family protein [Bacteroidetes bacterium]|nr:peptidoglycan DD-metalloendopeptidase family protein [Bacteroidota bacterium]MDA0889279.1 peptidoglycan DD-metalloendopeptidase family protein [Bacteroidota bacterium]MDA1085180.1 peptidoglycan DD-metalloendopeptidase family protein [Bacteroidota bacterium]